MRTSSERGAALIVAIAAMLLLGAVGAALVLVTTTDAMISANSGAALEAFYSADAAFERTLAELRAAPDFSATLNGTWPSHFMDGAPVGSRRLSGGSSIQLEEVESFANCARRQPCSDIEMNAAIRDRPWGPRNPRWRMFSWGLLPTGAARAAPASYVVSLIADDPSETDSDPWRDGIQTTEQANPGAGILMVRAEAFGRRGAHRIVEGTVVRQDVVARALWAASDPASRGPEPAVAPVLQVLAWREVR